MRPAAIRHLQNLLWREVYFLYARFGVGRCHRPMGGEAKQVVAGFMADPWLLKQAGLAD